MSATGSDAGMTLLEALVVMGLMALVATLAFPNIERTLGFLQLRETTGTLVANLRIARSDAVRSGQDVEFRVAPDGKSYGWSEGEARAVPGQVIVRALKGTTIVFYSDGTTSGGELEALADGRRISVEVDEATGAVSTMP